MMADEAEHAGRQLPQRLQGCNLGARLRPALTHSAVHRVLAAPLGEFTAHNFRGSMPDLSGIFGIDRRTNMAVKLFGSRLANQFH